MRGHKNLPSPWKIQTWEVLNSFFTIFRFCNFLEPSLFLSSLSFLSSRFSSLPHFSLSDFLSSLYVLSLSPLRISLISSRNCFTSSRILHHFFKFFTDWIQFSMDLHGFHHLEAFPPFVFFNWTGLSSNPNWFFNCAFVIWIFGIKTLIWCLGC